MSAPTVFTFNNALVRKPCHAVVKGLRAVDRGAPSFETVSAEHAAYIDALTAAGIAVEILPPLEAFPDSIFVEDPALVFTEGAIVMRPGAQSRFGEAAAMAPVLKRRFARVIELEGPGFADGGDILVLRDRVMIGLSDRTTREGARALSDALRALGKNPVIVQTPPTVLHFKSDCSLLDENTILSTERLAASGVFDGLNVILTPHGEEGAANALRINDNVFLGAAFPQTRQRLEAAGYRVITLATSEIAKIDAGLSCMSLRWFA